MDVWRAGITISGLLLMQALLLAGQDLDANITSRTRQPAAIADQISDSGERAAFLELYRKQAPKDLLETATRFLERYPRSAFLAQAYEIAAKSSFDIGDYEKGLDYAKDSIAFLPENPLLLVAVADVEARQKQNDRAIEDGLNALEYLDEFAHPISVSERDWPTVKRAQKSIALFAVGRAQLQKALEERSREGRQKLLVASLESLSEARELSPSDDEIEYARSMALISSGKISDGAAELARICKGPFADRALAALRDIYQAGVEPKASSFDQFLQRAQSMHIEQPQKSDRPVPTQQTRLSSYAGSETCQSCHADIYRNWSETGMATMLRPYRFENVTGDFERNNEFYTGSDTEYVHGQLTDQPEAAPQLFARMFISARRHYFRIRQTDGSWRTYPVDYTIGSKWQQAYATQLPNGQIHVFPIQYSMLKKRWINYWRSLDGPGTERSDPHSFERLNSATSYQEKCAICHTSQLRNSKGAGLESDGLEFREPGVGCEMCHGPSADHVVSMESGEVYGKPAAEPPIAFNRIESREFVAICAQCHMQSSLREHGPHGELNYSSSGKFYQQSPDVPFGEFTRKGFYKDGRFSQTTFIVEALERTKCFRFGKASCGTCHDPHGHDFQKNPTSLLYPDAPDRMCTGCHTQFESKAATESHSHHAIVSEGSRCISCHMPRIMDALTFSARTHQLDDIPNPAMTLRFGQVESPNACLLCHKDKSAQWVADQIRTWKATKPPMITTALTAK